MRPLQGPPSRRGFACFSLISMATPWEVLRERLPSPSHILMGRGVSSPVPQLGQVGGAHSAPNCLLLTSLGKTSVTCPTRTFREAQGWVGPPAPEWVCCSLLSVVAHGVSDCGKQCPLSRILQSSLVCHRDDILIFTCLVSESRRGGRSVYLAPQTPTVVAVIISPMLKMRKQEHREVLERSTELVTAAVGTGI